MYDHGYLSSYLWPGVQFDLAETIEIELPNEAGEIGVGEMLGDHLLCKQLRVLQSHGTYNEKGWVNVQHLKKWGINRAGEKM